MTPHLLIKAAALSCVGGETAAMAQTQAVQSIDTSAWATNSPSTLNRLNVAYRMGYQMTVKFKALGGFPALSDPGPATGTHQDHYYVDGFVLRDTRQANYHYTSNCEFN